MSYASWVDSLPVELLTPEEKLAKIQQKFLPEPEVNWSAIYGFMAVSRKLNAQIKLHTGMYELQTGK